MLDHQAANQKTQSPEWEYGPICLPLDELGHLARNKPVDPIPISGSKNQNRFARPLQPIVASDGFIE